MIIKPIIQKGLQVLKAGNLGQFGKFKLTAPKGAVSYDAISLVKDGNSINKYIFRDSSGRILKSSKFVTDNNSMQTTAQVRFYDYLDNPFVNKFKNIKEYKFNSDNECIGNNVWHFYHPNSRTVRFSRSGSNISNMDNFSRANGTVNVGCFEVEPISMAEYSELKGQLGRKLFVGEPWTPKETITSVSPIATGEIQECSAVGIRGKNKISLNHFNPNNEINYDRTNIFSSIDEQLASQGTDSKAFVLGSVEHDKLSDIQFKELLSYLKQKGISTIGLKTGDDIKQMIFKEYKSRMVKVKDSRGLLKNIGIIDSRYELGGQNIVFTPDGKIKMTNLLVDSELERGNTNSRDLVQKSFSGIFA